MSETDGRDRRVLTLLVQLFGRQVLDDLARAGLDDAAAIARAGPERVAEASGISLSLAQRIAAVVAETSGPAQEDRSESRKEPVRAPRGFRGRKAAPRRPAFKPPALRPAAPTPAPPEADPMDPFVDDVALVTWMGFSSKTHSGRLSYSVADGILEPVRPGPTAPAVAPGPRGGGPDDGGAAAREGGAPEPSAPAPQPPQAADRPEAAVAPPRTLPGSFWSFGRPAGGHTAPDDGSPRPPGRTAGTRAPAGDPARRNRHDH